MPNKSIPYIESILQYYATALGKHYNAYRNHVYRVYHLTMLLSENEMDLVQQGHLAIAAAFHDLGVWTHASMDYLEPSVGLANKYLEENNLDGHDVIFGLIRNHHKITKFSGEHQKIIEPFRRADLIDLSLGQISFGLPKGLYQNLKEEFPYLGFHGMIFSKVLNHALKHFWKPFPMIKK